jgi:hypothetical protein
MAEAKTRPTGVSVAQYFAAIEDPERRRDCKTLSTMMKRVTGCPAKMWGPSIVGFDSYHYRYDSGREGDSCIVGFSSRKGAISLYLACDLARPVTKALLAKLGKHEAAKGCVYVKRLDDVDAKVLEKLLVEAVRYRREAHGSSADG